LNASNFVAWKLVLDGANDFEILVATILSQNTSDRNALRAFENLRKVLGTITPETVVRSDRYVIEKAIAVAGLQRRKTEAIIKLAHTLMMYGDRFFEELRSMDVEEARRRLLSLPGVGMKTADVYLLMKLGKATYPIDTHNMRVLKRLGIASCSDGYEDIRRKVLRLVREPSILREMHMLIIQHGRETCRARNPACSSCIVKDLCARVTCV